MKKNIVITGLVLLLGFSSCNDFLDVKSDSKYDDSYVFGSSEEITRALNTVYAYMLSDNIYGKKLFTTFGLSSDVEFATGTNAMQAASGNEFKQFDCTPAASDLGSTWTSAYQCIEYANNFVTGTESSELYAAKDTTVLQQVGEAKCIRAMMYHDMVVLFGDIPFSFTRSYDTDNNLVMPIADRDSILTTLINDLRAVAPQMHFAKNLTNGVEHASKEFCWSLIARMALTRAGYSLRPDKSNPSATGTMQRASDYREYYDIARMYCDSVISSGTHSLTKSYSQVFIDECNYVVTNNDDPIFEIPFSKDNNGNVGYIWGPKGNVQDDVTTGKNVWGKAGGDIRLSAFYRYSFDRKDLRMPYTVCLWSYEYNGTPLLNSGSNFNEYCGKWSKFWTEAGAAQGAGSADKTGINYPYMRYADVLLMYAEAVNELENGVQGANGAKAISALKEVRNRAFDNADQSEKVDAYISSNSGSKEDFFKMIANERKWEFGGENMRWKDLVRWNKYAEVIRDVFYEYYGFAMYIGGDEFYNVNDRFDNWPIQMFWQEVENPGVYNPAAFPATPNKTLNVLEVLNPWEFAYNPGQPWTASDMFQFANDDATPKAQCLYSLRGYISANEFGAFKPNDMWEMPAEQLPPVRYILPIPQTVIQRSGGAYQNYYGYR